MSVYVLFHDVQYEGWDLLGVYSSLERAQEAGRAYSEAQDAYVVVVERELDGAVSDPLWEETVWEHRA